MGNYNESNLFDNLFSRGGMSRTSQQGLMLTQIQHASELWDTAKAQDDEDLKRAANDLIIAVEGNVAAGYITKKDLYPIYMGLAVFYKKSGYMGKYKKALLAATESIKDA